MKFGRKHAGRLKQQKETGGEGSDDDLGNVDLVCGLYWSEGIRDTWKATAGGKREGLRRRDGA